MARARSSGFSKQSAWDSPAPAMSFLRSGTDMPATRSAASTSSMPLPFSIARIVAEEQGLASKKLYLWNRLNTSNRECGHSTAARPTGGGVLLHHPEDLTRT